MKNRVTVTIAGQKYTLIADQDAAAVEKIAAHVDGRIREVMDGSNLSLADSTILARKRFLLFFISRTIALYAADATAAALLSINLSLNYHSISSTGVGLGLYSSLSTLPFRMCITWSAMGRIAPLWVITITVTPLLRQVSCKSFSMDLPVT